MTIIIHNHGAALSGVKAEERLKKITEHAGLPYLKVKKDFEKHNLDEWGTRYHKPPPDWCQKTKKGKQRKFVSDGFVYNTSTNKGVIIEQKHSDKHGTTEEKVFYDLKKIQKGVYGEDYDLWYVFTGTEAENIEVYKEFEKEAKTLGLPVKVIWGYEQYELELLKLKGGK